MRAALALAVTLATAAPAFAGPGGHMAGSFTASWTAPGWTGSVAVALDPGDGPRDAAVQKIRAGQHYRTGQPFSTEGAHVTALSSRRDQTRDCGDGRTGGTVTTFGAVSDNDTPFFVDRPFLDLLRGTGHISISPVRDNAGDPLPETGRDFFPVPGQVGVHSDRTSCIEGEPSSSEDDVAPIWGAGSDASAVPFGVPIFLESYEIPLREHAGLWSADGHIRDPDPTGSVQTEMTYDLKLTGPMSSWVGICKVPADKDLSRARSATAAVAIVRRAGWPHARFAGPQSTRYHRHGRFYVDEKFTSSGEFTCLSGKPKIFLAR